MYTVALRDEIRTWVLIQGKSQRAAAQHFGLSRNTVAKLLLEEPAASVRQYQRQAPQKTPVRDLALPHIEDWLKENEWLERWAPKQCWTAHRMWVELRKLGIPTVLDRLIQQAILQVLQGRWDPTFSEHSYGFRPGRSAHQAVAQAQSHVAEGYEWVVDIDLEKFFDRVNHDILMDRAARRISDKRLLRLIRAYLNAGVMEEGVFRPTTLGTPQGGVISPLLANIALNSLDWRLHDAGFRKVRNLTGGYRAYRREVLENQLDGALAIAINLLRGIRDRIALVVGLLGGLVVWITTIYCGPRTRTGKRRGKEGAGRYPELAALGIRKGATPALQSQVGRLTALLPSIELARDELRQQGPTLDEKTVHRMARQLGAEVLTARTRQLQRYRDGQLPAGDDLVGRLAGCAAAPAALTVREPARDSAVR